MNRTLLILAMFLGAGCSQEGGGGGGGGGSGSPEGLSASGSVELLTSMESIALRDHIANDASLLKARGVGGNRGHDAAIAEACGVSAPVLLPPRPSEAGWRSLDPVTGAVAVFVVSKAIDVGLSAASKALEKHLAEYTGVTTGGLRFGPPATQSFYKSVAPPALGWKCVRFTRMESVKGDKKAKQLAAEAIVKFDVTPAGDALLITPLRLYFDKPLARTGYSGKSEFGVALGVAFDATWRAAANGEGKSTKVWSATALSQKIVGINYPDERQEAGWVGKVLPSPVRNRFHYYNVPAGPGRQVYSPENPPVLVPLVPWSVGRAGPFGNGQLTLTLAEVGDPPAVLEFFSDTLKNNQKDIGDALKDAAKKALVGDESSSTE